MYKRILVPLDGSVQGNKGLDEAVRLASEHGGQIRLIHVLNRAPLASPDITSSRFDRLFEQMHEDGNLLLSRAGAYARKAGVPVDGKLVYATAGDPSDFVAQEARTWPADIVVCGTHARRGLMRVLLGSEGEQIVRHSPVPVLLVPTPAPPAKRARGRTTIRQLGGVTPNRAI